MDFVSQETGVCKDDFSSDRLSPLLVLCFEGFVCIAKVAGK